MKLHHKVQAVERVFRELDKELAAFKDATGLYCIAGCGLCCKKPDIAASPLEFLPLAYHLFKEEKALQWLEEIQTQSDTTICLAFRAMLGQDDKGFCSQYNHRGLICRLFGFSAMLDKHGQPKLATCKTIKNERPEEFVKATRHIESGKKVPVMRNHYFKLRNIDPDLANMLIPINQAIKIALDIVLSYYAYRKPRRA